MNDEFFWDEHPPDYGWVPPVRPPGGGGGGDVTWVIVEPEPEPEPESPEWDTEPAGANLPLLKTCPDGSLLTDGVSPELLTGSLICDWPPQLLIWLYGKDAKKHARCLIVRCSRTLTLSSGKAKNGGAALAGNFDWIQPGTFELSAKWQAGHYDYAEINTARFAAFGVDLGYRVLPLGDYVKVMTVHITDNYEIYVNDIRGALDGNNIFLG